MNKFKLLTGLHSHKGETYVAGVEGQDIVETDSDLTKITNGDQPRFELVSELAAQSPQNAMDVFRAEIQAKTIAELRTYAAEEEIDLGEATLKDEIRNIIIGEVELV